MLPGDLFFIETSKASFLTCASVSHHCLFLLCFTWLCTSHSRLSRCTSITTGEDGPIPRCKPFKYTYEKEIVIYPCCFILVVHIMLICAFNWCMLFTRSCCLYLCVCKPLTCTSRMHTLKSWTTSPLNVSACFHFIF